MHSNKTHVMRWPEHSRTGAYNYLAAKPENLMTGPTTLIMAEGGVSIGVGILFLISIITHFKTMDNQYGPKKTVSTLTESFRGASNSDTLLGPHHLRGVGVAALNQLWLPCNNARSSAPRDQHRTPVRCVAIHQSDVYAKPVHQRVMVMPDAGSVHVG